MDTEDARSEVIVKPHRRWLRSLLILIPLVVILIGVLFWLPRRSVWEVYRVNGVVELSKDQGESRARSDRSSRPGPATSPYADYFLRHLARDDHVTSVLLWYSAVDDQWLWRLRRFPNLERANLDGGSIGPGLKALADLPRLKQITVIGQHRRVTRGWIDMVDSTISGGNFLLVPQIESLSLSGFKGTISDLGELKNHPNLRQISLGEITRLPEVLGQLEGCQNIETLAINDAACSDDEMLRSLSRLSHLKTLKIRRSDKSDSLQSSLKDALPTTEIVWQP